MIIIIMSQNVKNLRFVLSGNALSADILDNDLTRV